MAEARGFSARPSYVVPGVHRNYCAVGSDGGAKGADTLWVTGQAGVLARVSTSGSATPMSATSLHNDPAEAAVGPDGAIWFTEQASPGANAAIIGRIDPSGAIRELTLPQGTLPPFALTAGPDGSLWIAVSG